MDPADRGDRADRARAKPGNQAGTVRALRKCVASGNCDLVPVGTKSYEIGRSFAASGFASGAGPAAPPVAFGRLPVCGETSKWHDSRCNLTACAALPMSGHYDHQWLDSRLSQLFIWMPPCQLHGGMTAVRPDAEEKSIRGG